MSKSRLITVNGKRWTYRVGRTNIAARAVGSNEKHVVDLSQYTGLSWDEIEKGHRKRWFKVTPAGIADWLKEYNVVVK
jgi:hypothetical protein